LKLKEYGPSWLRARHLKSLPVEELGRAVDDPLPVVVTLTSIPSRLQTLHLTIRSLLAQQRKPEKIILWLNYDLRDHLPDALTRLVGDIFEIRFEGLSCSHRKLIFALDAFPDRVLVTCDDDLMYPPDWLERLYSDHDAFPLDILAHECRRITRDAHGVLLPYRDWPTVSEPGISGPDVLAIGYGGVLYPPGCLAPEATDSPLFLRLAPKADDLWFKAMALRKGTVVRRTSRPGPKPLPIIGSQKVSLLKSNVRGDGNRSQWQALCDHFGLAV